MGARSLAGFYYHLSSNGDAFICREMDCWNIAQARPYIIERTHKQVNLYCCPEHIKDSVFEKTSARLFESPSIFSFGAILLAGMFIYLLLFKPNDLIRIILGTDNQWKNDIPINPKATAESVDQIAIQDVVKKTILVTKTKPSSYTILFIIIFAAIVALVYIAISSNKSINKNALDSIPQSNITIPPTNPPTIFQSPTPFPPENAATPIPTPTPLHISEHQENFLESLLSKANSTQLEISQAESQVIEINSYLASCSYLDNNGQVYINAKPYKTIKDKKTIEAINSYIIPREELKKKISYLCKRYQSEMSEYYRQKEIIYSKKN
jgi:hypothetical protein